MSLLSIDASSVSALFAANAMMPAMVGNAHPTEALGHTFQQKFMA
jgi:hypothetical protein